MADDARTRDAGNPHGAPTRRNDLQTLWSLVRLVGREVPPMLLSAACGAMAMLFVALLAGGAASLLLSRGTASGARLAPVEAARLALAALAAALLWQAWRSLSARASDAMGAALRTRVLGQVAAVSPVGPDGPGGLGAAGWRDSLARDVRDLRGFYGTVLPAALLALVTAACALVAFGVTFPALLPVAIVAYPLASVVAPLVAIRLAGPAREALPRERQRLLSLGSDHLTGAPELVRYGAAEVRLDLIDATAARLDRIDARVRRWNGLGLGLSLGVGALALVAGAFALAAGVDSGTTTSSAALGELVLLACSLVPMVGVAAASMGVSRTAEAAGRVLDVMDAEPSADEVRDGNRPGPGDVTLRGVTLLRSGEKVLGDLSLGVRLGQVTGVLGDDPDELAALCGLVMRFWDPDSGVVAVGDVRLDSVDTDSLHELLAYVGPRTALVAGTVRENLLLGREATEEQVLAACRLARLDTWLRRSGGLDARIRDPERVAPAVCQRLGLARALATGAPILVLEDPTARLDACERGAFLEAVDGLRGRRTVLLACRRQDEAQISDVTYRLERGRIK